MRFLLAVLATLILHAAWAADNPAGPQKPSVRGEVLEVKDVDAYTYLRLKTKDGEIWAAVSKAPVQKGADVTIENATVMTNFESKTLKRKFDKILFGTLAMRISSPADLGSIHQGTPKTAAAPDEKVAKAQGRDARTVAELFGMKSALKDKPAVVRGKVVKVTQNVMGKNWVHLRDGTGSAADQTNDLLVTTKELAQVGSIVVAKGVVRTDVNLGPVTPTRCCSRTRNCKAYNEGPGGSWSWGSSAHELARRLPKS